MVSSICATGTADDGFNSDIVKSLAATISISVEVETDMTTLDGSQARVSVKRKLLVLVMYTI